MEILVGRYRNYADKFRARAEPIGKSRGRFVARRYTRTHRKCLPRDRLVEIARSASPSPPPPLLSNELIAERFQRVPLARRVPPPPTLILRIARINPTCTSTALRVFAHATIVSLGSSSSVPNARGLSFSVSTFESRIFYSFFLGDFSLSASSGISAWPSAWFSRNFKYFERH